ncbi:MAG TPA: PQQ-binding-like beta-propeller repeat protein [Steroidobacteraceae bacterium]|nr:PQQ-binding-like beta-propeller repeat protein [Steroidobacteraceae bacterium]
MSIQQPRLLFALAALAASLKVASGAVPPPPAADWPAYNRTVAGDRYSPLAQITPANVQTLTLRCAYTLPELVSFQTGPLIVNGTMYFTTFEGSYAIDAASCKEKWSRHDKSSGPPGLAVNRGFAYLDGRLFRGTADAHVIALDAANGHVLWDRTLEVNGPGISIPMAPIAARGRVYIGNAGGDTVGVTGHAYALDARDGHLIWRFDVVPGQGQARATWTNSRLPISGGAFWTSFTLDVAKDVLYVPAGNPAPDFDTLDRTGEDLYADSVIALDAANGRLLGYNQLVKHDSHDWDVDSAPTLATTRDGRRIIASANKDGLLSILDRSKIDPATPAAGATAPIIPLLSQSPTTTRTNVDVPLTRDHPVHFCPGMGGGTEWNGAAFSPRTDSLFVGAVDLCAHVQLVRELAVPATGEVWFGSLGSMADMIDPSGTARGWVTAFDAENGHIRWKYQAPHPIVAGVTPTAGDVVFAADQGGDVVALDQKTGRVLWQVSTGQSIGGGLVVYSVLGQELLGVASGMKSFAWPGSADKSRILVYGLSSAAP